MKTQFVTIALTFVVALHYSTYSNALPQSVVDTGVMERNTQLPHDSASFVPTIATEPTATSTETISVDIKDAKDNLVTEKVKESTNKNEEFIDMIMGIYKQTVEDLNNAMKGKDTGDALTHLSAKHAEEKLDENLKKTEAFLDEFVKTNHITSDTKNQLLTDIINSYFDMIEELQQPKSDRKHQSDEAFAAFQDSLLLTLRKEIDEHLQAGEMLKKELEEGEMLEGVLNGEKSKNQPKKETPNKQEPAEDISAIEKECISEIVGFYKYFEEVVIEDSKEIGKETLSNNSLNYLTVWKNYYDIKLQPQVTKDLQLSKEESEKFKKVGVEYVTEFLSELKKPENERKQVKLINGEFALEALLINQLKELKKEQKNPNGTTSVKEICTEEPTIDEPKREEKLIDSAISIVQSVEKITQEVTKQLSDDKFPARVQLFAVKLYNVFQNLLNNFSPETTMTIEQKQVADQSINKVKKQFNETVSALTTMFNLFSQKASQIIQATRQEIDN